MSLLHRSCRPCMALTAGALTAAVFFLPPAPAFTQGSAPAARHAAPPAAAAGRATLVTGEFDLPAGFTLTRLARLRVHDAKGRLVELLPL